MTAREPQRIRGAVAGPMFSLLALGIAFAGISSPSSSIFSSSEFLNRDRGSGPGSFRLADSSRPR